MMVAMIYEARGILSIRDVAQYVMTININILITLAFERPPAGNLMAINYPDNKKINTHFMTLYTV